MAGYAGHWHKGVYSGPNAAGVAATSPWLRQYGTAVVTRDYTTPRDKRLAVEGAIRLAKAGLTGTESALMQFGKRTSSSQSDPRSVARVLTVDGRKYIVRSDPTYSGKERMSMAIDPATGRRIASAPKRLLVGAIRWEVDRAASSAAA